MLRKSEDAFWRFLEKVFPRTHALAWKHQRVGKYVIAGGTASVVNLFFLYIFTDIFGVWYVLSSVFSFIIAFFLSFTFQKFWTFEDRSTKGMHAQAGLYLAVALGNLAFNTGLIYAFVEYFGIHYLLAQIFSGVIVAVESFFIYRGIFGAKGKLSPTPSPRRLGTPPQAGGEENGD